MIKLRILIWEDYLGELNVITKVFVKERGEECQRQNKICAAGFEDNGRGRGPKNAGGI